MSSIDLAQDVALLDVDVDGAAVVVDVYGGPDNLCATVRFAFPDPEERAAIVARLRGWEATAVLLSLVRTGDHVRLVDERTLLRSALEALPGD